MRIAITGKPRSGKTTLCEKIFEELRGSDIKGIITKEVRERGMRIGFKFYDLSDEEEIWLAHKDNPSPIRVGKYGVFVENIEKISEKLYQYVDADVLIVDEVGPMELKSPSFIRVIEEIMKRNGTTILTIHLKSRHPILERIRKEFRVFLIDEVNRDRVFHEIVELIQR